MRKAFKIILDTNQSDVQCILEFAHAVGELTRNSAEMIVRVDLDEKASKNESKTSS